MRIAIDSNRYADLQKGDEFTVGVVRRSNEIWMPFIVLAELRAGFANGTQRDKNEKFLVRFLASPRVKVLFADDQTTHFYADLFRELRRNGRPVPTNDLWIAALTIQHDLQLLDRDTDFDAFSRLSRLQP